MAWKDLLDFGDYQAPEDRWLRFALRLSFALFVVGLEAVVIAAVVRLLIK